jgi:hypothetical protein
MTDKRPGQKLCYLGFMRFITVPLTSPHPKTLSRQALPRDTRRPQAFYKADVDQDATARLQNLGAARSNLVRAARWLRDAARQWR